MGPQKPRTLNPDNFGIGAPAAPPAPPPVFHLKPTAAQAQAKRVKAAQKAIKKRDDAIFHARQEIQTKAAIADRVSAKAGLTPTSEPFAGVQGGKGAPAKPFQGSDLTTKAHLAAARAQLRAQGGLQTPAQAKAESAAMKALRASRALTFGDTHQLPSELTKPSTHLSQREAEGILGLGPKPTAVGAPAAPPANVEHYAGRGRTRLGPGATGSGGFSLPSINFDALKHTLEMGGGPLGSLLTVSDLASTGGKALGPHRAPLPHVPIPSNFLSADAQAASKGKQVFTDDLTDKQKYGDYALGAEGRKYFVYLAGQNGYNVKDAPQWNDAELAARALGPRFHATLGGWARNFAADAGQAAALGAAVKMYGDVAKQSIEQRSLAPVAKLGAQYAQSWINLLPHVGDRPFGENVYEHPLSTYLAVAPFLKAGSGLIGKRVLQLPASREVELPTLKRAVETGHAKPGSERVTLPASQHPTGRAIQGVHDYFLARSQHPSDLATESRGKASAPNPAQHAVGGVGRVAARAGHALERRIVNQNIDRIQMHARLVAGHAPALAIHDLFKAQRQLPFMRTLLASWKENGGKEAEFEALFKHHGISTSSEQLGEAYTNLQSHYESQAQELEMHAAIARSEAEQFRLEGDTQRSRELNQKADVYEAAAKDIHKVKDKNQADQAAYSEQAGIDIHAPKKGAQKLVDAMRKASKLSADMLKQAGLIDEKGVLFGDWQHRITVLELTEGPHSPRAIAAGYAERGTPGYQLAHKIAMEGGSREAHDVARAEFHGTTQERLGEIPASEDVRSPLAEHHLGRNRMARRVMQVIEQKQASIRDRNNSAFGHDLKREAVVAVGNARLVDRAINSAKTIRDSIRGRNELGRSSRQADARERVDAQLAQERGAHHEASDARIARLEADLHVATVRKAPKTRIAEITREIAAERENRSKGFAPSENLLMNMRQLEKFELHADLFELPDRNMQSILDQVRVGPEGARRPLDHAQRAALKAAIQQELDSGNNLADLHLSAKGLESESAIAFKRLTGKDVSLAHAFDRASRSYLADLRNLRDQQLPLGHDPFHIHLHQPDTPYGLQPVRVTTGKQFEEGNYTRDMHFLVARDLTGLQRKAVEGVMFKQLSEEPLWIEDPPPGSVIPPGWVQAPKELVDNLVRINKDPKAVNDLLDQWRQLGTGTHSGGRVEENHVLISRDLKDRMQGELERGNEKELSWLLKRTNDYRRWMLFSLPRTYINNTVGNPILAMVMGAHMKDLVESIRTLNHDPERIPNTERRRGPISNVMEKPNAKMVGYQAFWRNANAMSEDIGRVMVYLMHARKAFKQQQGMHFWNRVNYSNELWRDFLVKAAKGETQDARIPAAKSAEAFGDMYKLSRYDQGLATAFLFHRWVGHMIHLTYWTLPTKYPGRALFIQQTAALANQYRKEHGLFPSWAIAYIPLWHEIQQAGGLPQDVVWSLGTGGINPFATPGQTLDFGTVDQPKFPAQALVANNITPLIRVPLETLYGHRLDTLQPFQDYKGNDIGVGPNWRVFLNGVIANLPIANTVFPRAGLSDDTIQIPLNIPGVVNNQLHPRYSAQGLYDPTMRSPQALGHGELYDWLLRAAGAFGSPIRPIDAAGNRTRTSAGRTLDYQAQQKTLRATKEGAAEFQKELELWQRDPAAWRKQYGSKP